LSQDELKALVGHAALAHVVPGQVLGVGTGSTVNHFIDALASMRDAIPGAVSSSEASTQRLQAVGIRVLDAQAVEGLSVYIDGADEIDGHGFMVKGGGAALTREKIVAAMAQRFVCIADESKLVQVLGRFPLPIEVLPLAREAVARVARELGGEPVLRAGFTTDNGNQILDVHGLTILDAVALEARLNQVPGVVTNGLFAARPADVALLATQRGIRQL
jgi:ribose 5-phosphate isomerase A